MNLHHCGGVKKWNIKKPSQYLTVLQQMKIVQEEFQNNDYTGVCNNALTHRDTYFNPDILTNCDK